MSKLTTNLLTYLRAIERAETLADAKREARLARRLIEKGKE